jgi:hypothetical protein
MVPLSRLQSEKGALSFAMDLNLFLNPSVSESIRVRLTMDGRHGNSTDGAHL